jgi:MinD-like ATPase involved in chromosome partitioning or flagellar assembly
MAWQQRPRKNLLDDIDKMMASDEEIQHLKEKANIANVLGNPPGPVKKTYAEICKERNIEIETGKKIIPTQNDIDAFYRVNPVIDGKVIGSYVETHFKATSLKEEIQLPEPSTLFI